MIETATIPIESEGVAGQILRVMFNRPESRNALLPDTLNKFEQLLDAVPPTTSALLIGGHGAAFCSGFDLTKCRDDPAGETLHALLLGLSRCVSRLHQLPIPVVIAAQGAAIAGGCALLGGADLIVSNRDAKLGYPVVSLGISPAVSAPYLMAQIGPGACRSRLLDPRLISGSDAHSMGLVTHVVNDPNEVLPKALSLATKLAQSSPRSMAATRTWLRELGGPAERDAALGAEVSLNLVNSAEQRQLLPRAWATPARAPSPGSGPSAPPPPPSSPPPVD
jgi:enoyl-CoA hydratase